MTWTAPHLQRKCSHRNASSGYAVRAAQARRPRTRRLTLERLEQRQLLSVVTNTLDAGSGSLRQAILDANATQQAAEIVFNIPGTDAGYVDIDSGLPGGDPGPDVFMIRPLSPLPALNNPDFGILVDGTSQADFLTEDTNPFGPEIILDGSQGARSTAW